METQFALEMFYKACSDMYAENGDDIVALLERGALHKGSIEAVLTSDVTLPERYFIAIDTGYGGRLSRQAEENLAEVLEDVSDDQDEVDEELDETDDEDYDDLGDEEVEREESNDWEDEDDLDEEDLDEEDEDE